MLAVHLQVLSELASVNIRLFPFAAALAKRGHTVSVADPDHLHQVLPLISLLLEACKAQTHDLTCLFLKTKGSDLPMAQTCQPRS